MFMNNSDSGSSRMTAGIASDVFPDTAAPSRRFFLRNFSPTIAAAVIAYQKGARVFRVHDVSETHDALKICEAVDRLKKSV